MKTFLKYGAVSILLFLVGAVGSLVWAAARTPAGPHGSCTQFPNVAAWLSFDESSGDLTVPTGCSAAATVFVTNGSPTYSISSGVPQGLGTAIALSTTNYFATAGDVAAFDFGSSDAVIEVWFLDSTAVNPTVFSKYNSTGWLIRVNAGTARFDMSDGAQNCQAVGVTTVNDGAWHYVRASWVNSTRTCSISTDGSVPVSATNGSFAASLDTTWRTGTFRQDSASGAKVDQIADVQITIGNATNSVYAGLRRVQPTFAINPQLSTFAEQTPGNCADPNVAAYLSMDNASGNLTVPTGCAASGTVFTKTGSPTYSKQGPPGLSTAISFDGAADYFETSGDVAALDPLTAPMVVEVWINHSSVATNNQGVVGKFDGGSTGWFIDSGGNGTRFWINAGGSACAASWGTNLTAGGWHYIRGTWNGVSVCTISVDGGTPVTTTQAVGSVDVTQKATVGERSQGGTNKFVGSIADVRVTIGNSTNNLGYNNGLNAITVPAVNNPGSCSGSNVAAFLSFDETSGNLTVPTGCGAAGTVFTANGTPIYSQTAPPGLGTAITFDGTTTYFVTPSSPSGFDVGAGTSAVIELWVKETNGAILVTKRVPAGADRFGITVSATKPRMKVGDGTNTCTAPSNIAITDGQWHFIRGTWDGTSVCTIQTDGESVVSVTQAVGSAINTQPVSIGADNDGTTKMTGSIADLRITIGNSTNNLGFNSPLATSLASSFTRATVSTRYNPSTGLLESVASDVPVVGAPIGASGSALPNPRASVGVYAGSATTFLALRNETLADGVTWTKSASVTATNDTTDVTAPDGTNNAEKFVIAGAAASDSIFDTASIAITATQTNTLTVWLRGAVGGEVVKLDNTENGVSTHFSSVTITNTWKRYVFTQAFSGAAVTARVGALVDGTMLNGTIYAWRPEFYQKAFAVPVDPATVASSVTVNADALSYAVDLTPYTAATACAWVNVPTLNGNLYAWAFNEATGGLNGRLTMNLNSNARAIDIGSVGSSVANVPTDPALGTWTQLCSGADWSADTLYGYSNGVRSASVADTNPNPAATTLRFNYSGGSQTSGFVSDFRLFTSLLTPAQSLALYNASAPTYAAAPKDPIRDWLYAQLPPILAKGLFPDLAPDDAEIVRRARQRVRYDPIFASAIEVHP